MNRIPQLEKFLHEEPHDPFNQYALALEYLKSDTDKAYQLFRGLIVAHPDYLPTYYPFAHLLIDRKEPEEAERLFKKGMERALAMSDPKTHRELQAAYNDWLFLRD